MLLVTGTRPVWAAAAPPTLVVSMEAPAGRVHGVLAGTLSAPPRCDIVLLTDTPAAEAPTAQKWCHVFPPRADREGYDRTPAYSRRLPLAAGLAQCGDLDGDGYDELTYLTRAGLFAFAGGPGGLAETAAPVLQRDLLVPPASDRVGAGTYLVEVTGDGRLDALLPVAEGLSLHAQTPGGTFASDPTAVLPFPVMSRLYSNLAQTWVAYRLPYLMVADLDRDGWRDIAVLDVSGCYQFRQQADGTFTAERLAGDLARNAGNSFTFALFGDWNADGHPDAGFARMEQRRTVNSTLRLYWGEAGRLPPDPGMTVEAPSTVMLPVFLDATGDGYSELLLYRVQFGLRFAINYFLRNRILVDVAVHRLGPDGTYLEEPVLRHRLAVAAGDGGSEPVRVAADLNGDGAMDMAVGLRSNALGVFLGDPERVLGRRPAWRIPVDAYGIPHVVDVNRDGRDDLLIRYQAPEKQQIVNLVLSTGPAGDTPLARAPTFD